MKNIRKMLALSLFLGILGTWNGHLALLNHEQDSPMVVFPYCAKVFPQQDQEMLTKGIAYKSQAELSRLLEDFLS